MEMEIGNWKWNKKLGKGVKWKRKKCRKKIFHFFAVIAPFYPSSHATPLFFFVGYLVSLSHFHFFSLSFN